MKKITLLLVSFITISFLYSQNCSFPTAYAELGINNIRAGIRNAGDMFWNNDLAKYQYPKIANGSGQTPKNLCFVDGIWVSGLDINNNLKLAASLYPQEPYSDFWTGSINTLNPSITNSTCSKFDRFFEVYKTELITHFNTINNSSLPLSLSNISTNIKEWPAIGNQYLNNTYSIDITEDLAPFQDVNNNNIYDPENGDYPTIKGDQCIFWVLNDLGNIHTNSNGNSLGVEIQCMAYAYI